MIRKAISLTKQQLEIGHMEDKTKNQTQNKTIMELESQD